MSTLNQLRDSLGRTWENLTEGWHKLRESAEHAMTRFRPLAKQDELDTCPDDPVILSKSLPISPSPTHMPTHRGILTSFLHSPSFLSSSPITPSPCPALVAVGGRR